MINEKDLQRCAKIEYDCWRENFAPMLQISEYLYYQTEISIKEDIKKILENKNSHFLFTHKKIQKNVKKSSPQTLGAVGSRNR